MFAAHVFIRHGFRFALGRLKERRQLFRDVQGSAVCGDFREFLQGVFQFAVQDVYFLPRLFDEGRKHAFGLSQKRQENVRGHDALVSSHLGRLMGVLERLLRLVGELLKIHERVLHILCENL